MKELNVRQLKAVEQWALNAGTVILGTLILGWALAPEHFNLLSFIAGLILYLSLIWVTLKVNEGRRPLL